MPTISVIIPVYNVAPFLPQCLDSLRAQTYADLECILIDDGSTDASGAICDAYARQDSRFVVLHQKNGGVSAARNAGLAAATGEWIGFVDSDDWAEPALYQVLADTLQSTGADIAMAGYYEYYPDPARPPIDHAPALGPVGGAQDGLRWVMTRNGYFTALWNKLYRREIVFDGQGRPHPFDPALAIGEDEVWLMAALCRSRRVACAPVSLYHWRSRPESATREEVLTEKRLSILSAKRQAIGIVSPYGRELVRLGHSRLFNDCYHLKVIAHRNGDRQALRNIAGAMAPSRAAWLVCGDVPPLRKAKVAVMGLLIAVRAKPALVDRVHNARRVQALP